MKGYIVVHLILSILLLFSTLSLAHHRCGKHGPKISFPFRLKGTHDCGSYLGGFDVLCTETGETILELPFQVKLVIENIDYESHEIEISRVDGYGCLPILNISASPFSFEYLDKYSIFNCPSNRTSQENRQFTPITCLSKPAYFVYAVNSYASLYDLKELISCTKMYEISVPGGMVHNFNFYLRWTVPSSRTAECYTKTPSPIGKLKIAGEVFASFLVVMMIPAAYRIYRSKKEDQVKIEKFLEDYKALKPARYSYADIKKITDRFSENLGEGSYGAVYKGKLSDDVFVAVKVLNNSKGDGEEFVNEVSTIGGIHHINVVRLVGYCAEGFHRALVYEYLVNSSLEKFISSPNDKNFLGWEKLQQIALGIAKGIEFLHQGCDQRILHFDIKPGNILLDQNLNPKISDFGQAKLCSKEKSIVSMTAARGTMGYIAPEVFSRNFGNVSYKSDIYSFGMLLLEMVGGRKKSDIIESSETSQDYFPEWIYNILNRGEELEIEIEEDEDSRIAKKVTIVGLWCIQWYPVDRPSIKVVIQMLEAEEPPSMPPNPFGSTDSSKTKATKPGKLFTSELEIISELE